MKSYRAFLGWWIGGLIAFGITHSFHVPLVIDAVPGGILDHQAASTAAEVNRIQADWEAAGLLGQARTAMLTDLVFIVIYSFGAWLGGLWFRRNGQGVVRVLGNVIVWAAVFFLLSDLGETILQLKELLAGKGSNSYAAIHSTLQPVKQVAWVISFVGIVICIIADWLSRKRA
ncbi:MAG: hypothetical protein H6918_12710 [Sphingomonadaceae bacterium]|nr:hypothetical protein [Sphingomonadaceae bacterium]